LTVKEITFDVPYAAQKTVGNFHLFNIVTLVEHSTAAGDKDAVFKVKTDLKH